MVAIPVRDEEEHLPACLKALAAQVDADGVPLRPGLFGIVLLLNNCRDRSVAIAHSVPMPAPMRMVVRELPPASAHAGGARRLAMDLAAAWLEEAGSAGLVLTTDADSRVGPSWIADNLAARDAGADAVAGAIALDDADDELLPDLLHRRGRLEAAYEAQLIEIGARLDPQPHNPWPHHATASGASLAVSLAAYRAIGGLAPVPLGEDKALVRALEADDARVRFAPNILVTTSGRLQGRAPGGAADTMRLRSLDPDAPCDAALEPLHAAMFRARWRGFLRRLHRDGWIADAAAWAPRLRLSPSAVARLDFQRFGACWSEIERMSPLLQRRPLRPADLPGEIDEADVALARVRGGSIAGDEIKPEGGPPFLPPHRGETRHVLQGDLDGLVA